MLMTMLEDDGTIDNDETSDEQPGQQNIEALARRRAARKLWRAMRRLDLDIVETAREAGIDRVTLENLCKFTPHLRTLEKVSAYLERIARQRSGRKPLV